MEESDAAAREIVLAYLESWHDLDPAKTAAFCAPEIRYESMPGRVVTTGRAGVEDIVRDFATRARDMHTEIRAVAVTDGGEVLVE
ncbi:nuclear transport factor 2 family protein [Nocardia fusca]|uniref:nuclear transport factor 2 family protein n=1 Tax=Nocardia fusca TaxID=941183 RepID=UPI0037A94760